MNGAGGSIAFWLLVAALVLAVLVMSRQRRQRDELAQWLANPAAGEIPEGTGAWRTIYSQLQRLGKEVRRERDGLANTLDHFRLAAQALPDGIILLDVQGHIEWLNAAACQHFSLDPRRDAGTLVQQLVRQREFLEYFSGFSEGRVPEAPVQLRAADPSAARVLSVVLIRFADSGILLLSRDITEMARTEVIRRDFVANVSHELRTPLTVISGFLEQFASDDPPKGEQARQFLNFMSEQANRMNRLVADLLTLSTLENDSHPPRDEPIDVPAMLVELMSEASALSNGRHRFVAEDIAPLKLRGSQEEVRSAFSNLVSNAIRYTPEGGTITIAWRLEKGAPVFSVTDTGIGIPKEHLPRLTERFYRVDKGRSTASGGTGLGLAIVKHVLARHGAQLRISSEPGKGSIFSAVFPGARMPAGT